MISRSGLSRKASDEEVRSGFEHIPDPLRKALMKFQEEGVKFGLARGGRVLIADEMGIGKTVQGIALACCYQVGLTRKRLHALEHVIRYVIPLATPFQFFRP